MRPTVAAWVVCLAAAVAGGLGLAGALQRLAPPDPIQARVQRLARQLTCPVCQGQSVAESTSVVAARMREEIRQLVEQGRSDDEIVQHFVDEYGPWIAGQPPRRGLYALAWALPALAAAAVAAGLARGRLSRGALRVSAWLPPGGGRRA